jgi:hypothetical protein
MNNMSYAVVTGASTGIGRELALLCGRAGYDLVLTSRNRTQLQAFAAELRGIGEIRVHVIAKDLSQVNAPAELYAELSDVRDEIEILVNNAGFGLVGEFSELDPDAQMEMLRLNAGALTHLSRLFAPGMIARRKGYILNVASTAAFQPGPLMAVYYATKAYVVSLSSALHNELKDRGVIVTALCPGPTDTEFKKRAGAESVSLFRGPNVMSAKAVAEIGFQALMKGKPLVVPGTLNATMAFLTRFAPRQFAASMARKVQEKPA